MALPQHLVVSIGPRVQSCWQLGSNATLWIWWWVHIWLAMGIVLIMVPEYNHVGSEGAQNTILWVWWWVHVRLAMETVLVNTLRPRQNGRHFADDVFKCIFLNENVWILLKSSLKFVPKGQINNTPSLVQIMAWRRPGDKSLSEPMMVGLRTHICVTRPQ